MDEVVAAEPATCSFVDGLFRPMPTLPLVAIVKLAPLLFVKKLSGWFDLVPNQPTKTTASRPSISPDGRFVAYHYLDSSFERSRWGIGISRIDDGTRIKRFDFPPTVVERIVKWTRDGRSIAFLNSPGGVPNIWVQPLGGGAAKPVTEFASDNIISFNWNTDGSQLAVIRGVETSDIVLFTRPQ
jgi:hypothetical protein